MSLQSFSADLSLDFDTGILRIGPFDYTIEFCDNIIARLGTLPDENSGNYTILERAFDS